MSSVVLDSLCLIFFCKAHFRFVFCSLAGKIILFRAWPGPCLLSKANFSRRKWFFVFNDLRKKIVSSTKSWSSRVVSTPAPANSSEPLTPPFCKKKLLEKIKTQIFVLKGYVITGRSHWTIRSKTFVFRLVFQFGMKCNAYRIIS